MGKSDTIIEFCSVEQGFQYAKTFFSSASVKKLDTIRTSILKSTEGDNLRNLGRSIPDLDTKAWDNAKCEIMKDLIKESFLQNEEQMRAFIKKTDGCRITHKQDNTEWKSLFPEVLMEVRDELKEHVKELDLDENFEPKVYVTYYGSKHVGENAFKVQISTSCPKGMEDDMDIFFESSYPNYKTMVGPHREGSIDDAEYSKRYQEQVLERNKIKILSGVSEMVRLAKQANQDVYLFCYEKPGDFCHRYLLNNFLNENGIACQELPEDRKMYKTGKVALYGEDGYEPVEENNDLVSFFECESPSYSVLTKINATAPEVDFTLAFAVDFNTAGERCTAKYARTSERDTLFQIPLPLMKDGGIDLSSKAVEKVVSDIWDELPEEFQNGEPCGFNIAGNGIYTLATKGVTQEQSDLFVTLVFAGLEKRGLNINALRSGGQTGINETCYAVSKVLDVPATILAPNSWRFRDEHNRDFSDKGLFMKRFDKDIDTLKKKVKLFWKDNKKAKDQGPSL